jgi:Holliday junction resolvase RusA-like endonuclease
MYKLVIAEAKRQIRHKLKSPVRMRYKWYEKDRRRDKDNISGYGRKVIQDGLVKAGVLLDDGWKDIDSFSDEFAVDKQRPRVEIEIEESEGEEG